MFVCARSSSPLLRLKSKSHVTPSAGSVPCLPCTSKPAPLYPIEHPEPSREPTISLKKREVAALWVSKNAAHAWEEERGLETFSRSTAVTFSSAVPITENSAPSVKSSAPSAGRHANAHAFDSDWRNWVTRLNTCPALALTSSTENFIDFTCATIGFRLCQFGFENHNFCTRRVPFVWPRPHPQDLW
jgi:hypothetical protein